MLLDIVDVLRCPADHEETWLVASAEEWAGRHVTSGQLGCPVCRASYAIRDGVADFSRGAITQAAIAPAAGREELAEGEDAATRLAAQLGLGDPGGIVLLAGRYGRLAASLASLAVARCIVVNLAMHEAPRGALREASLVRLADSVPLAPRSLRGAALDPSAVSAAVIAGVVRSLRPGARLVTAARMPVPAGVRVLARDAAEWVGESTAPEGAPVPLARRRG